MPPLPPPRRRSKRARALGHMDTGTAPTSPPPTQHLAGTPQCSAVGNLLGFWLAPDCRRSLSQANEVARALLSGRARQPCASGWTSKTVGGRMGGGEAGRFRRVLRHTPPLKLQRTTRLYGSCPLARSPPPVSMTRLPALAWTVISSSDSSTRLAAGEGATAAAHVAPSERPSGLAKSWADAQRISRHARMPRKTWPVAQSKSSASRLRSRAVGPGRTWRFKGGGIDYPGWAPERGRSLLLGIRTARVLLSGPGGSLEQAGRLRER